MKSSIYISLIIILLSSCKKNEQFKSPIIKKIDLEDSTEAGVGHYFYIENYSADYFNSYFLTYKAEKILDSLKVEQQIGSISFGSSMKVFNLKEAEINYEKFKNYNGIKLWYNGKINSKGYHEISLIDIYSDGYDYEIYTNQ